MTFRHQQHPEHSQDSTEYEVTQIHSLVLGEPDLEQRLESACHDDQKQDERKDSEKQADQPEHDRPHGLDSVVGGLVTNLADETGDLVGEVGCPVGISQWIAGHEVKL